MGMALAYPIALIIVFKTKQVKEYYAQPDPSEAPPLTSPA
jgi:hypothetical protein